jgi:hypothetical protein
MKNSNVSDFDQVSFTPAEFTELSVPYCFWRGTGRGNGLRAGSELCRFTASAYSVLSWMKMARSAALIWKSNDAGMASREHSVDQNGKANMEKGKKPLACVKKPHMNSAPKSGWLN